MASRISIATAVIAALGFTAAAQAQQQEGGHHPWRGEAQGPHQQQQWRGQQQQQHAVQQQWQQRQQWQAPAYQQRQYVAPQQNYSYRAYDNYAPRTYSRGYYAGAPQYRAVDHARYYAGGYAPYQFRARPYWVDWRSRGLYAPPYGYQWVQTDTGDVLLIALATGLIANAILGGY